MQYTWKMDDVFFFFYKQKTAYDMRTSDWSSDVCSADLWSMISNSQTRYGSGAGVPGGARQGSARAWTSYQASSLSAIDERLAGTRRLWHEERHEQNARGAAPPDQAGTPPQQPLDRKSTRLNSSP